MIFLKVINSLLYYLHLPILLICIFIVYLRKKQELIQHNLLYFILCFVTIYSVLYDSFKCN